MPVRWRDRCVEADGHAPSAHRPGEGEDLGQAQDVGDEQHEEHQQDGADDAAGGRAVDLVGQARGLVVGEGGDPFVGAKLGNLLLASGYRDVSTEIKTFHFDNREPARRKTMIAFWEELLLSAADQLLEDGRVTQDIVDGMRREISDVQNDPNAVFFYSFVQARATVY